MKNIKLISIVLSVCFFVVLYACQAQDSTRVDTTLIEKIFNDPLAVECRTAHAKVKQMILYKQVDLETFHRLDSSKTVCDLLRPEVQDVRGALEFREAQCKMARAGIALEEKYPEVNDLSNDQQIRIFFGEPLKLSEQDAQQLYDIRRSPDH